MLGALAVALVLSSPLPPQKPAAEPPALPVAETPATTGAATDPGAGDTPPQARETAATATTATPDPAAADAGGATPAEVPLPPHRPKTAQGAAGADGPAEQAVLEGDAADAPVTDAGGEAEVSAAPHDPATVADGTMPLPPRRPAALAEAAGDLPEGAARADAAPAAEAEHGHGPATAGVPRPMARPDRDAPVVRAMMAPGTSPADRPGVTPRNMVCRDPRIVGAPAASFVGGIPGCGIFEPVRIASIAGVQLSSPATLDCRTARTFADWVSGVAQPAAREELGSGIKSLWIMGTYSCRTRNNRPGQRLSEHSVGRAVDIGGITLSDGRRITVRDHWGQGASGGFLRRVHKGACGGFTTVIGPDGDRYHQDHLHLDTAYRDSTYCR